MSPRRIWTAVASFFTLAAVAGGCVLPFLRWQPQAPFDVLGVGWVLMNIPNLFLWTTVLSLAIIALYSWCRAILADC